MELARSLAVALAISVFGPASADSAAAEKHYESIREAWEKARAAGGYGLPFVAVPKAIVAAFVDDRPEGETAGATAGEAG